MSAVLHYFPASQPSRAVTWFIAKNKIPNVELKVVNLMKGEHIGQDFTTLSRGYQAVPVLQVGDDVLTQSGAILQYLSTQNGNADLPQDPMAQARVYEALLHHDNLGRNLTKVVVRVFTKPELVTMEDKKAFIAGGAHVLKETLEFINDALSKWRFIAGDTFSLADYLLASEVTQLPVLGPFLPEGCELSKFPHIQRYLDDLKTMDAYDGFVAPLAAFAALGATKPE